MGNRRFHNEQDWIITGLRCFLDEILAAHDGPCSSSDDSWRKEQRKDTEEWSSVIKGTKSSLSFHSLSQAIWILHVTSPYYTDNKGCDGGWVKQWEFLILICNLPSDPHSLGPSDLWKDTLLLDIALQIITVLWVRWLSNLSFHMRKWPSLAAGPTLG